MILKNSAATRAAAHQNSFNTRCTPLTASTLQAAIQAYTVLMEQYVQVMDFVNMIAGPSLMPMGSPPAAPDALVTVNVTHASLSAADKAALPSVSSMRIASNRVSAGAYVFLDQAVSGPISMLASGTVPARTLNGVAIPAALYSSVEAHVNMTNVGNVRIEVFAGLETAGIVMTWNDFLMNVARPLMDCYQMSVRLMYDRLKATAVSAADEAALWSVLHGVTPDATQAMLDKLGVLRDPNGAPMYYPPLSSHVIRDKLVAAVLAVPRIFPESVDI